MDFKQRISKAGVSSGYTVKTLSDSIVLNNERAKIVITWRKAVPEYFDVFTSLPHPRMGSTTLKRSKIDLSLVLKVIENPREHTQKGVYTDNKRLDKIRQHIERSNRKVISYEEISAKRNKKRIKVTGRMALYREIWRERPHKSEISDEPLIENMQHPLWRNQFLHILPHGKFKNFEFRKDNVVLGTHQEHTRQTTDPGSCKADPKWDGFWARYAALFDEYERDMKANKFKFKS